MSDLHATSIKRFQPLLFAGRFVSFLLFGFLLCAGWIALSYCKNTLFFADRNLITPATTQSSTTNLPSRTVSSQTATENKLTDSTSRLIYLLPSDKQYFHSLKHLPANVERLALSENAAIERGLKPCPVCIAQ
jgi:hypothetical protein